MGQISSQVQLLDSVSPDVMQGVGVISNNLNEQARILAEMRMQKAKAEAEAKMRQKEMDAAEKAQQKSLDAAAKQAELDRQAREKEVTAQQELQRKRDEQTKADEDRRFELQKKQYEEQKKAREARLKLQEERLKNRAKLTGEYDNKIKEYEGIEDNINDEVFQTQAEAEKHTLAANKDIEETQRTLEQMEAARLQAGQTGVAIGKEALTRGLEERNVEAPTGMRAFRDDVGSVPATVGYTGLAIPYALGDNILNWVGEALGGEGKARNTEFTNAAKFADRVVNNAAAHMAAASGKDQNDVVTALRAVFNTGLIASKSTQENLPDREGAMAAFEQAASLLTKLVGSEMTEGFMEAIDAFDDATPLDSKDGDLSPAEKKARAGMARELGGVGTAYKVLMAKEGSKVFSDGYARKLSDKIPNLIEKIASRSIDGKDMAALLKEYNIPVDKAERLMKNYQKSEEFTKRLRDLNKEKDYLARQKERLNRDILNRTALDDASLLNDLGPDLAGE